MPGVWGRAQGVLAMDKKLKVDKAVQLIAQLSIDKSSQVLSKLIKAGAKIEMEKASIEDISKVTERISAESDEVVGAFVDLIGDAPFKFLFFVKVSDCFLLTDILLKREQGTTKELDVYASSSVQEIGNILASSIANVFSTDFQIGMTPSPPIVVHDFAGTIFAEYILSATIDKDEILIIESKFTVIRTDIKCHMFILPIAESEKVLSDIANTMSK